VKGNTEVAWLNGASSLATVFQRLGGAGSAGYAQDWVGLAANLGAVGGKIAEYASKQNATLIKALKDSGTKVLPTPTAILDAAMLAIFFVDFLNGFGPPDTGSAFSTASDKIDNVLEKLDNALPDSRDWSGDAATAYINQNAILKGLVQSLKDTDKKMKNLVASQGNEVKKAHTCISVTSLVFTACLGVALALYLIPITGPEISCAWQIVTAFGGCMSVFAFEMFTLSNSMSIRSQIDAVALEYGQLQKDAQQKLAGSFATLNLQASTAENRVSSFKAVSDSLHAFAAPPTVSSLADTAGASASPAQHALLSAPPPQQALVGASSATETPKETPKGKDTTTPPPAVAPVSMAKVGQFAQMAGQLSQPISQTMQQVQQLGQQISQAAQQAKGAAQPAEKAAAGAAPAAEGAERAPIEAAERGAEQQGDRPARVL
jgi:uncharacterized protein YukE